MPTVIFIEPNGSRHEVEAHNASSVMTTAVDNLVPGIVGDCGGELSCATCHVFVQGEWPTLGSVGPNEDALLEATAIERRGNSRLACQLKCTRETDGLTLEIPEDQ